jgi:hypothetical protein
LISPTIPLQLSNMFTSRGGRKFIYRGRALACSANF